MLNFSQIACNNAHCVSCHWKVELFSVNSFPKLSSDRFRICFSWVYQVNSFVVFNTIKNEIQHLHHCFRVSLRLNVFNFQNFFLDFKNVNSFWDLGEKNLNCILVDVICGFEKRMNKVQQFSEQTSSVNFQVVVRDHKNQKCICTFLESRRNRHHIRQVHGDSFCV